MTPAPSDADRVRLGQELLRVHARLRARVSHLSSAAGSSSDDARAFLASCLAFCRALRRHHAREDEGAFQVLRRRDPSLGDVLDDLMRDHAFLDPMLDRLEVMAADPARHHAGAVARELAGIAAVLENHLAYEERVLVGLLDSLQVETGSREETALRAPSVGIFESTDEDPDGFPG